MRLWTIQPMEVYHLFMESGIYRCDPYRSDLLKPMEEEKAGMELDGQFSDAYDWLVRKMEKQIGPRPECVIYPVWAWYRYGGKNKPDLRRERWGTGNPGEKLACRCLYGLSLRRWSSGLLAPGISSNFLHSFFV